MSNEIKHVIFDWAGTLYDDHEPSYLTTEQVIKELSGKSITFEEYKEYFCLPVTPFYRRYGIELSIDEINTYYFDRYVDNSLKGKIYEGVIETLDYLRSAGKTMSILSTLRQDLLDKLCEKLDLQKYFKKIHGSVCDKREELKQHLLELNIPTNKALFIGDTDHDVEAANQDGVLSGCVLNGYQSRERLIKAEPRFIWGSQREWAGFFKELF